MDLQLLHRKDVFVHRVSKVDDHGPVGVGIPVRLLYRDRNTVPEQAVHFLNDLADGRGGQVEGQRLAGILQCMSLIHGFSLFRACRE